jgi:hypothetical protein
MTRFSISTQLLDGYLHHIPCPHPHKGILVPGSGIDRGWLGDERAIEALAPR